MSIKWGARRSSTRTVQIAKHSRTAFFPTAFENGPRDAARWPTSVVLATVMAAAVVRPLLVRGHVREFEIEVSCAADQMIGLHTERLPLALLVSGVSDTGAIAAWNNMAASEYCIAPMDHIITVNGCRGTGAQLLLHHQCCRLLVRKPMPWPLTVVAWERICSYRSVERRFETIRALTRGAFARVSLVCDVVANHKSRVRKDYELRHCTEPLRLLIRNEGEILARLDHPAVVRMYKCFETDRDGLSLILEHIPGVSVEGLLRRHAGGFPETTVATVARWLFAALGYCHARGVVHRDVKPANIMVYEEFNTLTSAHGLKLIDFGLGARYPVQHDTLYPLFGLRGTPAYMAPEMVRERAYRDNVDVWSAGLVLIEFFVRRPLFACASSSPEAEREACFSRIREYAAHGNLVACLKPIPKRDAVGAAAQALLQRCLLPCGQARPAAVAVLRDPWMQRCAVHFRGLPAARVAIFPSYALASKPAQCCAFLVASHFGAEGLERCDLEAFDAAFLASDIDLDGRLSRPELQQLLGSSASSADLILAAVGFGDPNFLSYVEYVAIILHAYVDPVHLAAQAFRALDGPGVGTVCTRDLSRMVRLEDCTALEALPGRFTEAHWMDLVLAEPQAEPQATVSAVPRGVLGATDGSAHSN